MATKSSTTSRQGDFYVKDIPHQTLYCLFLCIRHDSNNACVKLFYRTGKSRSQTRFCNRREPRVSYFLSAQHMAIRCLRTSHHTTDSQSKNLVTWSVFYLRFNDIPITEDKDGYRPSRRISRGMQIYREVLTCALWNNTQGTFIVIALVVNSI